MNRARIEGDLVGLELPATKGRIVQWMREHDGHVEAVQQLPEREYKSPNEVGEALAPVQPLDIVEPAHPGTTQSGDPPGRDRYTA
jgi:Protein of unknown function (DUF2795)